MFSRESQWAPHIQPWQLDYNQPPGILDMPKSSRTSLQTTPSTPVSDFPSLASSHSSLTPSLQNISLGRGCGRLWKHLIEPSYEDYPAEGTKEEKAKLLKMKATRQQNIGKVNGNECQPITSAKRQHE